MDETYAGLIKQTGLDHDAAAGPSPARALHVSRPHIPLVFVHSLLEAKLESNGEWRPAGREECDKRKSEERRMREKRDTLTREHWSDGGWRGGSSSGDNRPPAAHHTSSPRLVSLRRLVLFSPPVTREQPIFLSDLGWNVCFPALDTI